MSESGNLQSPWLRYVDLTELRHYAEVSGDSNPIHLDQSEAIAAGHPQIICHGMLAMTDIGRWLIQVMDGWRIETFHCRFLAPVPIHSRLRVSANYADEPFPKTRKASLNFSAQDQNGAMKVDGQATFRRLT